MDGLIIKPAEGYIRTVADQNWQVAGIGDFNGDGKDDILWRNADTGENYLYPMDGLAILPEEGYLRTVADPDWGIAGVGDFDGDFKADVLWRNSSTGENYLYPMNGTAIKPMEGYLRTVADLTWKVAGVGDFDGDGKADVLWRNSSTGENYLYPMTGNAIKPTEGYLRTVADQNWQVKGTGDHDGDGKADVLWRNSLSGENYLYPMDGTTMKPTEGYLRTVADLDWEIAGAGNSAETAVCAGACEIPGEGGCMPAPPGTDPKNACGGTYVCDGSGTSCPSSCLSDAGCSATSYCTAGNECAAKLPSESPCSGNNQCMSGVCSGLQCQ
jgi:hypothetical protein